jgi:hypothetical protein
MAKHTQHLHLYRTDYFGNQDWVTFSGPDQADRFTTYVSPVEVSFEVPDNFNLAAAKLSQLAREQEMVRAAFQKRMAEIHEEISKLQALTHEVAA